MNYVLLCLTIFILAKSSLVTYSTYLLVEIGRIKQLKIRDELPRYFSNKNDFGPMQIDETRKFELDVSSKPNCGLSREGNIVEISIKKEKTQKDPVEHKFGMLNYEYTVYIVCRAGYIPDLAVGGEAEDCGIGKVLMQLCLNEPKLHKISKKDKNNAMKEIKHELQVTKLEEWVKSKCSKILYLDMSVSPMTKAYVYFNSVLSSGFTDMFVKMSNREIYPNEGPCSTKNLKERYTDEGTMVNGNDEVIVHGRKWFFCYPKIPSSSSKCTIL